VARTERLSISLDKTSADGMRALISDGTYTSMSAAMSDATRLLLEKREEQKQWWAETARRCDEAEKHPERLLDADTFFRQVRAEIEGIKKKTPGL